VSDSRVALEGGQPTIRLDRLQSKARRLIRPGRIITFPWGRGSGKTYFDGAYIHERALLAPNRHIGLLMPTLKQARAVFWPGLLQDYYGPLKPFLRKRPNLTELVAEYANGSRLTTWGAENANAMRGQRFDDLVQDETDDIDPDIDRAIVEPTFSKSGLRATWLKTGTPKRGRYGSLYLGYRRGQAGTPERAALEGAGLDPNRYVSLLFRSNESPQVDQKWLDLVRRDLIASGRITTYLREYECDFDAAEGLVYSMFEQGLHVAEPDYGVPWNEILVGVDHGFSDPGVILPAGVTGNGRDATVHVLEEVYQTEKDTTWWCDRAAEIAWKYRAFRQRWYADPSRPDRIADFRRVIRERHSEIADRISIQQAENDIDQGISAVADRLMPREDEDGRRYARLYISPRCTNTLAEQAKYRRRQDPANPERFLDEIIDKDNHGMDALRYLVFTRFGGPDRIRHEID
jgi:hypothetical protein